ILDSTDGNLLVLGFLQFLQIATLLGDSLQGGKAKGKLTEWL
ncbi:19170_t:CDS:2, partial [Cetraspora pellucida]